MTMSKEGFVYHPRWAATPCPTLAVVEQRADVTCGDKIAGACEWVFFNDGANRQRMPPIPHYPKNSITYHQLKPPTSQSMLKHQFYYCNSAIYFCAEEKNTVKSWVVALLLFEKLCLIFYGFWESFNHNHNKVPRMVQNWHSLYYFWQEVEVWIVYILGKTNCMFGTKSEGIFSSPRTKFLSPKVSFQKCCSFFNFVCFNGQHFT